MIMYMCRYCKELSTAKDIDDRTVSLNCVSDRRKAFKSISKNTGNNRYRCPKCIRLSSRKEWKQYERINISDGSKSHQSSKP